MPAAVPPPLAPPRPPPDRTGDLETKRIEHTTPGYTKTTTRTVTRTEYASKLENECRTVYKTVYETVYETQYDYITKSTRMVSHMRPRQQSSYECQMKSVMRPETRSQIVTETTWVPPTTSILTSYHKIPEMLESEPEVQVAP